MKSKVKQTLVGVLVSLALLCFCAGCVDMMKRKGEEPPPQEGATSSTETGPGPSEAQPGTEIEPEPQPETEPYLHTVRYSGETLSIIAQWYTGSWRNWKGLAEANGELNPNRINIGDKILIPNELLKKAEPLPQDFISSSTSKEKPETTEEKVPEGEELELFGPKTN